MTPLELLAATLAITVGSMVQAASGVGAGFLIVPLLAWINLSLVPAPMIFASLTLSGLMAWRERGDIDREHLSPVFFGLVPGSALGAWIISSLPAEQLGLVFAVVILLAIALTVIGLDIPLNKTSAVAAGGVSGAMGASTGIGAPVLALLFQHASGPRVRATLALIYTFASVLILLILALFGRFGASEAAAGALMMPGFLAGYWIANRLRHRLDQGATRPAVLIVSAASAIGLLVRSLVS
jgi:uncharacterized membrane protein YfcA